MRHKTYLALCVWVMCGFSVAFACKCWDAGDAISGSITVNNAKLCEEVTHTSSYSDKDHWVDDANNEGTPSDSLTYSWSKSAGTNPQTGTWKSGTTSSSVDWQAPCYTGTVNIRLDVNDVPDSMDDPCPDVNNTRTDPNIYATGTATVSLPSGCTTGEKAASLSSTKTALTANDCNGTTATGRTMPPSNQTVDITAYYKDNECKWVFDVNGHCDIRSGVCTGNFIEITDGNDPDLDPNNYCDIVDGFRGHLPATSGGQTYGHAACTEDHEDEHYRIFNDYLDPNAADWLLDANNTSALELAINCDDPNTTTCQAAETTQQSAIEAAVSAAFNEAWTWMDPAAEEAQCRAAAGPCYDAVADSICAVWDCNACP